MDHTCVSCEGGRPMMPFSNKTMMVAFGDGSIEVSGLSGWQCTDCSEIEFDEESAARYAAAGDELVLESRRKAGAELRRIRKKLGLNQAEAARLTGGGHNAFSRYENGIIAPAPAVINLFKLLEKHPEELDRLAG